MADPCLKAIGAYLKALKTLLKAYADLAQTEEDFRVAQATYTSVQRTLDGNPGDQGLQNILQQAKQQLQDAKEALAAARKALPPLEAAVRAAQRKIFEDCDDIPDEYVSISMGSAAIDLPVGLPYTRKLDRGLRVLGKLGKKEVGLTGSIKVVGKDGKESTYKDRETGEVRNGRLVGLNDDDDITIFYGPGLRRLSSEELAATVKHEVGHSVFRHAPQQAQDDWETYWQGHLPAMPTPYARANPADGFCEAYEAYKDGKHLDRETLRRVKAVLKQLL